MHKRIALKRILKFLLKQLLHVSVQSPSSGSAYLSLLKLQKLTTVTLASLNMRSLIMVIALKHVGAVLI